MRLYIAGLLTGLLFAAIAGAVACTPTVGPQDGSTIGDTNSPGDGTTQDNQADDIGVKISALKDKKIEIDCADAITVPGRPDRKGVELKGIKPESIYSSSKLAWLSNGTGEMGGDSPIYISSGKAYVACPGGKFELRLTLK